MSSSLGNTDDKPEVNLSCMDVLQLTFCTNRMLWGKFGDSINFPREVTDDKVYFSLQKFTNKTVSDMLLRETDEEPSISLPTDNENWMNEPRKNCPIALTILKPLLMDLSRIWPTQ